MGINTTVLIINDYAHDIAKNKDFPEILLRMLSSGETGQVIPGVKIIESHHADTTATIEIGGNTAKVLRYDGLSFKKAMRSRENGK